MIDFPLVTIVVPVYNSQNTIEDTINSVISQSYGNWEVICVDDGSSDSTISILENIIKKESRIRYFVRERLPKGGSVCRNIGAMEARGEYLIFLDSDDLLSPRCLEHRVREIHGTDNMFVAFPMASFNDGDFSRIKNPYNIHIVDYDYLFAAAISAWQVTSSIIRRDFFIKLGGFNEQFSRLQDIEFHLRAITSSYNQHIVKFNAEADCFYRLSSCGYSISKLSSSFEAYKQFMTLLSSLLRLGKLQDKYKLSRSLLLLFSNLSIIKYSLWNNNKDISQWSSIIDVGIREYITNGAWYIITILNKQYDTPITAKLNFYLGRMLLYICMRNFKTR